MQTTCPSDQLPFLELWVPHTEKPLCGAVHCYQVCHLYDLPKLCRHRATEQGNKHKLPSVAEALINLWKLVNAQQII